jgi:hypothetical protein
MHSALMISRVFVYCASRASNMPEYRMEIYANNTIHRIMLMNRYDNPYSLNEFSTLFTMGNLSTQRPNLSDAFI